MLSSIKEVFSDLKSGKISKAEAISLIEEIRAQKDHSEKVDHSIDVENSLAGKSGRLVNSAQLGEMSAYGLPEADASSEELCHLQTELIESLANVLYLQIEEIHPDKKFIDLGLDSIVGVEWVERINREYNIQLKVTKIYDHPSVRSLSKYILDTIKLSKGRPNKVLDNGGALTGFRREPIMPGRDFLKNELANENRFSEGGIQALHRELVDSLAKVLFLSTEEITLDTSFVDLGLDSIVGVEWVEHINKCKAINLRVTKIYDYPTVRKLSEYISALISEQPSQNLEQTNTESRLLTSLPGAPQQVNPDDTVVSATESRVQYQHTDSDFAVSCLGPERFRQRYGCRMNYFSGSMYRAIASERLVTKMAHAGILSFFGSAGFDAEDLERHILSIQKRIKPGQPYGMCLIHDVNDPDEELKHVNLFIQYNIPVIEAAAFFTLTPAIVYCRVKGLQESQGSIRFPRRIIAKCSRLEVAELFLSPPPKDMVNDLLTFGMISKEEARLSQLVSMADDIAVEADSGGHTDGGVSFALIPTVSALRDQIVTQHVYKEPIHVGAGGGIGTPKAIASAFALGAEFVFTGSINQCSVESGAHKTVKELLASISIHDTTLAPAGDMFEIGAKVQVLSKFTQFSRRANKLFRLYQQYTSLDEIPYAEKVELENFYFKRSIADVWMEVRTYKAKHNPEQLQEAEGNPKIRMKLVFQWYFAYTSQLTFKGRREDIDNFQVHCGPAMGAFNQWAKGTIFENWTNREVDQIALVLMDEAAKYLYQLRLPAESNRLSSDSSSFGQPRIMAGSEMESVAVIGMAGRFPKSSNLEAFWDNIANGADCISEVPISRWPIDQFYDSDRTAVGKSYCKWMGVLEDADKFDPLFFNISPAEAELMDPQQRLFLECAWHCIEDAGINADQLAGSNCGIYVGSVGGTEYGSAAGEGGLNAQGLMGAAPSILPARISYLLDLKGPSLSIDTACSSSLVAVSEACNSLILGSSSLMLVGGVCVLPGPNLHIMTSKSGMLSEKGRCYTFDHRADGFVPGEGVGVVLLKRLSDAKRDGDRIHGIIKAWGTNQDGKTNGITAPSAVSQTKLEATIYEKFKLDPGTVTLVEAHGTGTKLGDPIEVNALVDSFRQFTDRKEYCALGSVKSNLGHLQSASGIAGLLKILLAMRAKQLPPTINYEQLNPHISLDGSPFFVNTELRSWESEGPRRATVSSFGFSGTNAHIIVEEQVEVEVPPMPMDGPVVIPVSAASAWSRHQYLEQLLVFVQQAQQTGRERDVRDLAYTFQVGRKAMDFRVGILAESLAELEEVLSAYIEDGETSGKIFFADNIDRGNSGGVPPRIHSALCSWLHGNAVSWDLIFPARGKLRLWAPLYPFEHDSYWLKPATPPAPRERTPDSPHVIHPLVQTRRVEGQYQRFHGVFHGREFFFEDHIVNNLKLFPAAAYLEMVRAAAELSDPQPLGDLVIRLTNIMWIRPFYARFASQSLNLRMPVALNGDTPFEIYSDSTTEIHCRGEVARAECAAIPRVDLEKIKRRCQRASFTKTQLYSRFHEMGILYGVAHRNINLLLVGDEEVLAELGQPSVREEIFDPYDIHPGLLDAALQSVIGTTLLPHGQQANGRLLLPFAVQEVQIFAHWSHYRWAWLRPRDRQGESGTQTFDVDVLDAEGRCCVAIRGLLCRPYATNVGPQKELETGLISLQSTWTPRPLAPINGDRVPSDKTLLLYGFDKDFAKGIRGVERFKVDAETSAQLFHRYAVDLFGRIKQKVTSSTERSALIQVLIPQDESMQVLHALSAMLKTANIENPRVSGQVIAVTSDIAEVALMQILQAESRNQLHQNICYESGQRYVLSYEEIHEPKVIDKSCWKEGGVYLIVGGNGGLGRIFSREIAACVRSATLILVGKSAPSQSIKSNLSELEAAGVKTVYKSLDISDKEQVEQLIESVKTEHGGLSGIIHSAGILKNNFIRNKSEHEFAEVMAPKTYGAEYLDVYTKSMSLDFFVLFSSGAGVAGNLGQIDYAAANAYLNEFARERDQKVHQGLRSGKTISISWPLWREGGMTVDEQTQNLMQKKMGMLPMTTETGIETFYGCINYPGPQMIVVEGQKDLLRKYYQKDTTVNNTDQNLQLSPPPRNSAHQGNDDLSELTKQYLCVVLADETKIPINRIDPQQPLEKYGINSILAMQLTATLETRFGALSKTLFFEYQTLAQLSEYFIQNHRDTLIDITGVRLMETAESDAELIKSASDYRVDTESDRVAIARPAHKQTEVAVIGISGRYPNSPDLDRYWENLANGVDCIREVPASRWDAKQYFTEDKTELGKHFSKWGGFIDDVEMFDPAFFNISPRDAIFMDPQERLFLEHAWTAVEDAGYCVHDLEDPTGQAGALVGVYAGVMYGEYQLLAAEEALKGNPIGAGGSYASIANRVSYVMNLHGPSMTVDTMCSSSLTSVHLACQDLRSGTTNYALAGGVNLSIHPNKYRMLSAGQFISSRGHCESFGVGGDGYIPGEGVGVLFLKRLQDAIRDSDTIYGVIKGSALNHGGKTNGYSVPNPNAQAQAIGRALKDANVNPNALSYIEAHGTGTRLGDPIEISGLSSAFGSTLKKQYCRLGSVKSNIGHCESAAGIAGITKVLLQMKHGKIAPSLHSQTLNPNIRFEDTPFIVNQELCDWERPTIEGNLCPRIAGVSAFGAGGSNAHLVLEEYRREYRTSEDTSTPDLVIVPLSAKNPDRLRVYVSQLKEFLQRNSASQGEHSELLRLQDLAYTLQVGRIALEVRAAFVVTSLQEFSSKLEGYLHGDTNIPGVYSDSVKAHSSVLSVFSSTDVAGIFATWREQGKLSKIAEMWTKGLEVEWNQLYRGAKPKRIPAPTYPFARERYWVEASAATVMAQASKPVSEFGHVSGPLVKPTGISLSPLTNLLPVSPLDTSIEEFQAPVPEGPIQAKKISEVVSGQLRFSLTDIQKELVDSLASALFMSTGDVDLDKQFVDMGLDSIVAVEWIRAINKKFGTSIQATRFYDYPTILDFAQFLFIEINEDSTRTPGTNSSDVNKSISVEQEPEYVGAPTDTKLVTAPPERAVPQKKVDLPKEVERRSGENGIAIIGMSGRYPEAENLSQYWANLTDSRSSVRVVPDSRWSVSKHYDPQPGKPGKVYCKWLGMLSDVEYFDADFFGIPKAEAIAMDPQHRLFLEEGYLAFEDAGYSQEALNRVRCGVYVGLMSSEYSTLLIKEKAKIIGTSNSHAVGTARLPYFLNLKGPAIPIDTACSSSLVATHLACQALKLGEIDMALVGGASLYLTLGSFVGMCAGNMLSPEGNCKPFDREADGFVPGEGVGAIILKRLSDAERDNDRILGVIIGSGINQDGKTNGLGAPSRSSQQSLIEEIYKNYQIDSRTISYVEAHGTGTRLGDPIELEALSAVFSNAGQSGRTCAVGSVKGNIGHTSAASGMASVQKVLLSMKHRQLVPTLNFNNPSSFFDFSKSGLEVNTENRSWTGDGVKPRRAAISSFGFSGTNAHLVIEEYPLHHQLASFDSAQHPAVFVLSAKSSNQLDTLARRLHQMSLESVFDMRDLAFTLQTGRTEFAHRCAFISTDQIELKQLLADFIAGKNCFGKAYRGVSDVKGLESVTRAAPAGMEESYSRWMQGEDMSELAKLWVEGTPIEWERLYRGKKPRKVSAPSYPFKRSRFWVADSIPDFVEPESQSVTAPKTTAEGSSSGENEKVPVARIADKILSIVAQQLAVPAEGIDWQKPFSDLGISSIQLIKITQHLRQKLNRDFPATTMFEYKSIAELAEFIAETYPELESEHALLENLTEPEGKASSTAAAVNTSFPELIQLNLIKTGTPVFWIHGGMGGVQPYFPIADKLDRPVWGIQAKGYQTDKEPAFGIDAMVDYYLSIIRDVQSKGPYELAGYSFGGVLSYEIARRLQDEGESVRSLFMIDSIAPDKSRKGQMSSKTSLLQAANFSLLLQNYHKKPNLIHRNELHLELSDIEFSRQLAKLLIKRGIEREETDLCTQIEKTARIQRAYQFQDFEIKPLRFPDELECIYVRNESGLFWGDLEPYFYYESEQLEIDHTDYWSPWGDNIDRFHVVDVPSENHMNMLSNPVTLKMVVDLCRKFFCLGEPVSEELEQINS